MEREGTNRDLDRRTALVLGLTGISALLLGATSAAVAEEAIDWLDGPIVRVTSRDLPMPYNDKLEKAVIPQEAEIADAIRRLVRRDREPS